MTPRWVKWLTTALMVIGPVAAIVAKVLAYAAPTFPGVESATFEDLLWSITFTGFLLIGCLIVRRAPDNKLGWVLVIMGTSEAFSQLTGSYAITALLWKPGLPGGALASWVVMWLWVPTVGLFSLVALLFPTGNLPSPRWRWVAGVAIATSVYLIVVGMSLWPYRGVRLLGAESPDTWLVDTTEIVFPLTMLCILASLISMVFRFRRARGVEREQLKWLAFASVIGIVTIVFDIFLVDMLLDIQEGFLPTIAGILSSPVVFVVAIAIAIFKYRVFEIDLIINRTLVYGLLTAVLGGLYVGIVAAVGSFAGDSNLTVAAATLAVAGLFQPLRGRVQRFIDHRFYRRKFDAQSTIDEFAARLRDEIDLESLSGELVAVVGRTMQPAYVSLWLMPGRTP